MRVTTVRVFLAPPLPLLLKVKHPKRLEAAAPQPEPARKLR